jgi:hypothetical protein
MNRTIELSPNGAESLPFLSHFSLAHHLMTRTARGTLLIHDIHCRLDFSLWRWGVAYLPKSIQDPIFEKAKHQLATMI